MVWAAAIAHRSPACCGWFWRLLRRRGSLALTEPIFGRGSGASDVAQPAAIGELKMDKAPCRFWNEREVGVGMRMELVHPLPLFVNGDNACHTCSCPSLYFPHWQVVGIRK